VSAKRVFDTSSFGHYSAFRPVLYLATWISTLILIISGDFTSMPEELRDASEGTFWVWGSLALWSAPVALLADFLIKRSPPCKYRAMWLRLGADIAQFFSILVYQAMRLYMGDHHIYSTAVLFAALIYVALLIVVDGAQLIGVERLAKRLSGNPDGG
jgi:hypothetical protein